MVTCVVGAYVPSAGEVPTWVFDLGVVSCVSPVLEFAAVLLDRLGCWLGCGWGLAVW